MDLTEALAVWLGPCNDEALQEAAERIAALYGYEESTPAVILQAARRLKTLAGMLEGEALKMVEALLEEDFDG